MSFNRFCSIGHRGACERKGRHSASWPRATPTSGRGARFSGGLPPPPRSLTPPRPPLSDQRGRAVRLPRCPDCPKAVALSTRRPLWKDGSFGHRAAVRWRPVRHGRPGSRARSRLLPRRFEPEAAGASSSPFELFWSSAVAARARPSRACAALREATADRQDAAMTSDYPIGTTAGCNVGRDAARSDPRPRPRDPSTARASRLASIRASQDRHRDRRGVPARPTQRPIHRGRLGWLRTCPGR